MQTAGRPEMWLSLPARRLEPFDRLVNNGRLVQWKNTSFTQRLGLVDPGLPHGDSIGQNLVKSEAFRISGWTHLDVIIPQFFSPVRRRLGGNEVRNPKVPVHPMGSSNTPWREYQTRVTGSSGKTPVRWKWDWSLYSAR